MALADHVGEELQEEGHQQQADVHAVDIGIGGDDDLLVAQVVHLLLDVERRLQQVELLVLVDDLFGQPEAVERLAAQREDRLRAHVAALGDRARRRVTLRDEDHRLLGQLAAVRAVDLAVAQLAVVERDLLGRLAGLLLDARDGLALLLVLDDLLLEHLRRLGMLVQVVVEVLAQELHDEVADRGARLRHLLRAELRLGLRLEDRARHADRDGADERRADVGRVVVLVVELADGLGDGFAEGRLVRAALRRVLSVDERVAALAVARAVGDHHLDVGSRQVDGRIERLLGHVLVQQVEQSVLRGVGLAVQTDRQPAVQVGVVAHQLLDILQMVGIGAEDLLVDAEADLRAVLLREARLPAVALLESLLEVDRVGLAVAHRAGREAARKVVHGLDAHAVQTHRLLEGRVVLVIVVFAARVHHAHRRRERVERNAAPVIAHGHLAVRDRDVDLVAEAVHVFVDRVVDHLLDEDIDAVVGLRAVAQFADVHAGAQPHVLTRRERADGVVAIVVRRFRIE